MRDRAGEAANAAPDALYRFLTAEPAEPAEPADRQRLAPRIIAAVVHG
ncbi:hypothetical protein [Streptomyces sp. NBC_01176]|nr:hypothetical protein OG199_20175 [Streptomyces sp. NBC_01176]